MTPEMEQIIYQAYEAFNARDIASILEILHPDILWANGWEGGYVQGHEALIKYWHRQWKEINPMAYPFLIKEDEEGHIEVHIRQVAKDINGTVLFDGAVRHIYTLENNKITSMEIDTI